jgi:acyl carrier protein
MQAELRTMPASVLPVLVDLIRRRTSLDPARLVPDVALADLALDSVAAMDLVVDVERAFDLSIPGADLQALRTLGDVARYLERRRSSPRSGPLA